MDCEVENSNSNQKILEDYNNNINIEMNYSNEIRPIAMIDKGEIEDNEARELLNQKRKRDNKQQEEVEDQEREERSIQSNSPVELIARLKAEELSCVKKQTYSTIFLDEMQA
jgi:hypothetical protein